MANILFTKEGVEKLLKNLEPTKASDPDNISTRILKLMIPVDSCPDQLCSLS
jgi:hypothetical protein